MGDVAVQVENLWKTYRVGQVLVDALRGVNLTVRRGKFAVVLGPSGSGKTTLLNLIGGLDKPSSGRVYIDGEDLGNLVEGELTEIRRNKIGFIFQLYNLIPVLTAFENVELPMLIAGVSRKESRNRAQHLLRSVGLPDRMDHKPDELSGGEQQRVTIARALANRPSIILADEPTADLDPETGMEVAGMLRELAKKETVTVIAVTHDPVITRNADRILKIRNGQILH